MFLILPASMVRPRPASFTRYLSSPENFISCVIAFFVCVVAVLVGGISELMGRHPRGVWISKFFVFSSSSPIVAAQSLAKRFAFVQDDSVPAISFLLLSSQA